MVSLSNIADSNMLIIPSRVPSVYDKSHFHCKEHKETKCSDTLFDSLSSWTVSLLDNIGLEPTRQVVDVARHGPSVVQ
jgi:hypothetical protein